jgi:DNA-binding MarR family transcriptional regulator
MDLDDYTDVAAAEWSERMPEDDVTTMEITMRLRRLVRALDLEVAKVIGASPLSAYGDYQVLALLHRSGLELQPKEIAEMLQLTRSGTTGRLDRLAELGLVDRSAHPDDARSALVTVTAEGAQLASELFRSSQDVEAVVFDELSREERAQLVASLRRALLQLDDTADSARRD